MVIESILTVGVVHAVKVRTTLSLLTVGDLVKAVVCGSWGGGVREGVGAGGGFGVGARCGSWGCKQIGAK